MEWGEGRGRHLEEEEDGRRNRLGTLGIIIDHRKGRNFFRC